MRLRTAVCVMVAAVGLARACAGEAPSLMTQWNDSDASGRSKLLMRIAAEVQEAKRGNPGWKPGADLGALIQVLAKVPAADPNRCGDAHRLFMAVGEPSDACIEFCGGRVRMDAARSDHGRSWLESIMLLETVGARNLAARDVALEALALGCDPGRAFSYLGRTFPQDEQVRAAAVSTILKETDKTRVEAALKCLGNMAPDRATAAAIVPRFVSALTEKDGDGIISRFVDSIRKAPVAYRGLLDKQAVEAVLTAARTNERHRFPAVMVVLGAAKDVPFSDVAALLLENPLTDQTDGLPLFALAFLPKEAVSADVIENKVPAFLKKRNELGRTGLTSLVVRHTGDPWAALKMWEKATRPAGGPDLCYWQALFNCACPTPMKPEDWRRLKAAESGEGAHFAAMVMASSLSAYPDAKDWTWLLDESIDDPATAVNALEALYLAGRRVKKEQVSEKAVKWLRACAAGEDRKPVFQAAFVLAAVFGEEESAKFLLSSPEAAKALEMPRWSPVVDLALEVADREQRLGAYRAMIAEKDEQAAWHIWLIDMRLGKDVGPVPVESLAADLAQGQDQWLATLRNAGTAIYPHLHQLRDPYLLMAGTGKSRESVMKYIGTLDSLEIERTARNKRQ